MSSEIAKIKLSQHESNNKEEDVRVIITKYNAVTEDDFLLQTFQHGYFKNIRNVSILPLKKLSEDLGIEFDSQKPKHIFNQIVTKVWF